MAKSKKNPLKLKVPPSERFMAKKAKASKATQKAVLEEAKRPPKQITADTPPEEGGPDWSNHHVVKNQPGYFDIWPKIMRYPNKHGVRREVRLSITTWRGFSLGASHYYARITVESNAAWDPSLIAWHTNDKSNECKDIFFRAHVETLDDAMNFFWVILKHFYGDQERYRWCLGDSFGEEQESDGTWEDIKAKLARSVGSR